MGPVTAVAIYITIWWTALFVILPLGVKSHHEMGIEVTDGGDPGAPVNPNMKKKFITTTWVSAIIFALLLATIHFGWIKLPTIPANY